MDVNLTSTENDDFDVSEYDSYADGLQKYKSMAKNLHQQDRFEEALAMYQKALDIQLNVYGDHTDTARTYKNMGRALAKQGKQEEALKMFQNAFGIYCRIVGPDHPATEKTKDLMEWMRDADFQTGQEGDGKVGTQEGSDDPNNCTVS